MFDTDRWKALNMMIYQIYTTDDLTVMRTELLKQLHSLISFDGASFFLSDPKNGKELTSPVLDNCTAEHAKACEEFSQSGGIYKNVHLSDPWHYSLNMLLEKEGVFLGALTCFRTIDKGEFRYEDMFVLDILKTHLTYRLQKSRDKGKEKLTITEAAARFDLTKREITILRCLLQGMDNEEMEKELSISVNTVKKHILNLYRKMKIKNRVQLFKMVLEQE